MRKSVEHFLARALLSLSSTRWLFGLAIAVSCSGSCADPPTVTDQAEACPASLEPAVLAHFGATESDPYRLQVVQTDCTKWPHGSVSVAESGPGGGGFFVYDFEFVDGGWVFRSEVRAIAVCPQ